MTTPFANLNIVAIGDEDMVNGLRLAGVTSYVSISNDDNAEEDVRTALEEAIKQEGVGIIALQEEYAEYATDIIARVRGSRNLTPIIIEVPSKYGTRFGDVSSYYKSYVREYTGFEVEI